MHMVSFTLERGLSNWGPHLDPSLLSPTSDCSVPSSVNQNQDFLFLVYVHDLISCFGVSA